MRFPTVVFYNASFVGDGTQCLPELPTDRGSNPVTRPPARALAVHKLGNVHDVVEQPRFET